MNNSVDNRLARASTAHQDRIERREAALEALRKELDKGMTPDESYPAEDVFNRLKRKYGNQNQSASGRL